MCGTHKRDEDTTRTREEDTIPDRTRAHAQTRTGLCTPSLGRNDVFPKRSQGAVRRVRSMQSLVAGEAHVERAALLEETSTSIGSPASPTPGRPQSPTLSSTQKIWAAQYKYLRRAEEQEGDGLVVDLEPMSCDNVSKNIARVRSQHSYPGRTEASTLTPLTSPPRTDDDESWDEPTSGIGVEPESVSPKQEEPPSSFDPLEEAKAAVGGVNQTAAEAVSASVAQPSSPARASSPRPSAGAMDGDDSIVPASTVVTPATRPTPTMMAAGVLLAVLVSSTSLLELPSPPPPPPPLSALEQLLSNGEIALALVSLLVVALVGALIGSGAEAGGDMLDETGEGDWADEALVTWRREAAGSRSTSPARLKRV